MQNSTYKKALNDYVSGWGNHDSFSQHMPDQLNAKIQTIEDFWVFLKFVSENLHHQKYFEIDAPDTEDFITHLSELSFDSELIKYAKDEGIVSDYGILAYLITLALGHS